MITSEINKLVKESEILGEKGEIEKCEELIDEVENLKKTLKDLKLIAVNPTLASKQMKVR